MLTAILLGLGGFIALVLFLASKKPDTFRIERQATIGAPADRVYSFIEDFRRWTAWSPWEALDPGMRRTYGGAERGVGAVYEWQGNDKVGAGKMEIKSVEPNARVTIQLEFFRPWEARNIADFVLSPGSSGTEVSWAMSGPSPYMSRVMSVFMNLDRLVGKEFETGLAKLKTAAEQG